MKRVETIDHREVQALCQGETLRTRLESSQKSALKETPAPFLAPGAVSYFMVKYLTLGWSSASTSMPTPSAIAQFRTWWWIGM